MVFLLHLFTLLFVALKLTHVIDWSWFAVISPSLVALTPLFIIMILCVIAVCSVNKKP